MMHDIECSVPCDECGEPCGYAAVGCKAAPHNCPSCPLPNGMCAVRFGEPIDVVPEFKHVRDLEEFEGPLLSEWTDKEGRVWIEKWVDCSEDRRTHRWALFQTTSEAIDRYLAGETFLIGFLQGEGFLIESAPNGDETWSKRGWKIRADRLPSSYRCSPSAKHDPSLRRETQ